MKDHRHQNPEYEFGQRGNIEAKIPTSRNHKLQFKHRIVNEKLNPESQMTKTIIFQFIVRMVIRVCQTGEEPEDNREFDTTAVSGIPREKLQKLAMQGKLAAATTEVPTKKKGD